MAGITNTSIGFTANWNMKLRIKPKHRIKRIQPDKSSESFAINQVWSVGFMGDGRRFRTFNLLDDYNREGLGIEVDFSLPSGTCHSFTGADHRVARETTGVALRQGPRAHQPESDHWAT